MNHSYGICHLAYIPIRTEPSHRAEMGSQLVFGEIYHVREQKDDWLRIENEFDNYSGWIALNAATLISASEYDRHLGSESRIQVSPFAELITEQSSIITGAGSVIYLDNENQYFIGKQSLKIRKGTFVRAGIFTLLRSIKVMRKLENFPYLWGGRTSMGIDCSGLTQLVYRIAGIALPRDAWQQEQKGRLVNFEDKKQGDLAFFENETGRVVHVGIVLENNTIFHASGKVRIDSLHEKGIYQEKSGKFTHKLKNIKRIEGQKLFIR